MADGAHGNKSFGFTKKWSDVELWQLPSYGNTGLVNIRVILYQGYDMEKL